MAQQQVHNFADVAWPKGGGEHGSIAARATATAFRSISPSFSRFSVLRKEPPVSPTFAIVAGQKTATQIAFAGSRGREEKKPAKMRSANCQSARFGESSERESWPRRSFPASPGQLTFAAAVARRENEKHKWVTNLIRVFSRIAYPLFGESFASGGRF